jgi:hypothetical protein
MTKPLLEKTLTTFMKTANNTFLLRIQFFEVCKKVRKGKKISAQGFAHMKFSDFFFAKVNL